MVVVGNPANTNAYICKKYAPSIPPQNFTALTRLDQNRAQAQVSPKPRSQVSFVWHWLNIGHRYPTSNLLPVGKPLKKKGQW